MARPHRSSPRSLRRAGGLRAGRPRARIRMPERAAVHRPASTDPAVAQHHDVQHRVRRHGRRSRLDPACGAPRRRRRGRVQRVLRQGRPPRHASRATTTSAVASTWSRGTRSSMRPDPMAATCSCSSRPGRSSPSATCTWPRATTGPAGCSTGGAAGRCSAPSGACAFPSCDRSCARPPASAGAGIPTFIVGDLNSPSHEDWTDAAVGHPAAGALPGPLARHPSSRAQGVRRLVAGGAPRRGRRRGADVARRTASVRLELEPAPRRAARSHRRDLVGGPRDRGREPPGGRAPRSRGRDLGEALGLGPPRGALDVRRDAGRAARDGVALAAARRDRPRPRRRSSTHRAGPASGCASCPGAAIP